MLDRKNITFRRIISQILCNKDGFVSVYVSSLMFLFVLLAGLTVDLGRAFLLKNKMEASLEAAVMSAAISSNSLDYKREFTNLFNANFTNSMPIKQLALNIQQNNNTFIGQASAELDTSLLNIIDVKEIPVVAKVEIQKGLNQKVNDIEVAIAIPTLTNTATPAAPVYDIKQGLKDFVDRIYKDANNGTAYVSVIPFSEAIVLSKKHGLQPTGVNPPSNHLPFTWMTPERQIQYNKWLRKDFYYVGDPPWDDFHIPLTAREAWWMEECNFYDKAYVDLPNKCTTKKFPNANVSNDVADLLPINNGFRFSIPLNPARSGGLNSQPPIIFASTQKSTVIQAIDDLNPGVFAGESNTGPVYQTDLSMWPFGYRERPLLYQPWSSLGEYMTISRPNVGMMWTWFALSERWRGFWDVSRTNLPLKKDPATKKVAIFIMGLDRVDLLPYIKSDGRYYDAEKTADLCQNMKAQGIEIYTILLNPFFYQYHQLKPVLQTCASKPDHFFFPGSKKEFEDNLKLINDSIYQGTVSGGISVVN